MSHPLGIPASTRALLYLALIVLGMGQTVVFAILPMLGRELEVDKLVLSIPAWGFYSEPKELAITTLTAVTSLAFFIGAPYWGRRSDTLGRKRVIVIGLLGYAVGTFCFNGVAHLGLTGVVSGFLLYAMFVGSRVALVLLMSATLPAATAYVVDSTDISQRTAALSKLNAFAQIGTMVGPALASFVVFGFLAPLYIQASLVLLVALLVILKLPETDNHINQSVPTKKLSYFDPRYRRFLLIGLIMFTMMGMVQMTLGFYFEDELGLAREDAALRYSLAMVASSAAMLFAQMFLVQRWKGHPLRLVQFGLPFACLGYLLIAIGSGSIALFFAMSLFGFGMGLAAPGYSVTATFLVEPQEQGALAGLNAAAPAMGFVFGPLLGGYLYKLSPYLTYASAAGVILVLWLFVLRLKVPARPY